MITGAPLPGWNILAGLLGRSPAPDTLAAPWLQSGERAQWYSRSSWALAGLTAAWTRQHGRAPTLWLPAYFCNATLDPLRRTGASLRFVAVESDLTIDWQAARRMAPGEMPDLVLLPHFFGVPQDAAAAHAFCLETGATLIEDCAHVLAPTPAMGATGDHVLWSPHKLLAVPQGGLLVTRPGATLTAGSLAAAGAVAPMGNWLIKRLVQKTIPAGLLPPATRSGPQEFGADPATGLMPDTPVLNPAAARLLAAALSGMAKVAAQRRANANALLKELMHVEGWRPLFDPTVHTPYRLVMLCSSSEVASERFAAYRQRGIPVESWPDMPPEVMAAPERFGAALQLRCTLLCFPVHQSLEPLSLVSAAHSVASPLLPTRTS